MPRVLAQLAPATNSSLGRGVEREDGVADQLRPLAETRNGVPALSSRSQSKARVKYPTPLAADETGN